MHKYQQQKKGRIKKHGNMNQWKGQKSSETDPREIKIYEFQRIQIHHLKNAQWVKREHK